MIDLHTHSTASDGTDTPTEVVDLAVGTGLHALALTDHDTLAHLPEARAAAARVGLELVSGCELSCDSPAPGTMHLLVYFVEDDGPLAGRLAELRAGRDARNERIVEALRGLGIPITSDDVRARAHGESVGRPHIAEALVDAGRVPDISGAFDRWLAKGRPAYVERPRLDAPEAIRLAHASGAVTSLAHPETLGYDDARLDGFVAEAATVGLDALEAFYSAYSPERRTQLAALAARHGLAVSGGSDHHGAHKPGLTVGVGRGDLVVDDDVLDGLRARAGN